MKTLLQNEINTLLDLNEIAWTEFANKDIFITGGTGLIGSLIIRTLAAASLKFDLRLHLIVLARNVEKAKERLSISVEDDIVSFIEGSVESFNGYEGNVNYIIHAAYPTSSSFFNTNPVETIKIGIQGTINMLDFAVKKKVERFVFVSSMEAYGTVEDERLLDEKKLGFIDLYSSRSCYPESKRMCENIVSCYTKEYGLNASCIRLAQTFGPGIPSDDRRVFAMMARCAISNKDIVLNTTGESKHPYLYNFEAVSAILIVLLKGDSNVCYNAANPETYCSIFEMGELVANQIANGRISVRIELKDTHGLYPPASYLNLDVSNLMQLGWKAKVDLVEMFNRLIEYITDNGFLC